MGERTFTVKRIIPRTPWDVYDFFADPAQQGQWRDAQAPAGSLADTQPYTRVEYSDALVLQFEPADSGTLVTLTKTHYGRGFFGSFLLRLRRRKSHEEDLVTNLVRAENAMIYDAI